MRLKGIHTVKSKTGQTYYYAWRGGPRLRGQPGSADFTASYNEAVKLRETPSDGTLFSLIAGFKASTEFASLAPRTKAGGDGATCR